MSLTFQAICAASAIASPRGLSLSSLFCLPRPSVTQMNAVWDPSTPLCRVRVSRSPQSICLCNYAESHGNNRRKSLFQLTAQRYSLSWMRRHGQELKAAAYITAQVRKQRETVCWHSVHFLLCICVHVCVRRCGGVHVCARDAACTHVNLQVRRHPPATPNLTF